MIVHPIDPVFDTNSRILILGSFPSVKSRESGFFYGHPQNRYWKVLSAVFEEECPETIPEKKKTAVGVRGMKLAPGDKVENVYYTQIGQELCPW